MKTWFDRSRYELFQEFRCYFRPHKRNLAGLSLAKLGLLISGLISPYLFKLLVDNVMIQKEIALLGWICLGYLMIYAVETGIHYVQLYFNNQFSVKFSLDLRMRMWKKIIRFDDILLKRYMGGDLKNRLDQDVDSCEAFAANQIVNYGYSWLLSCVNGVILLTISWKLAVFGFLMVPLSFWMTRWLGNGVKRSSEGYRQEWGAYEDWLQKSLGNWKEVKVLGIEKREAIQFTGHWKRLSKLFFKQQMYWYGNRSFVAFKDFFVTRMNLYFLGGLLIFNGELSVGSLIVFMRYYEQFFTGINNINNLDLELKKDIPSLTRVAEILKLSIPVRPSYSPKMISGQIRFSAVSFLYDNATGHGVKDIDFTVEPGQRVAIVGRSGSGKSTLVQLLTGVYTPQQGSILLDGVPLQEINSVSLRRQVGIVMQENTLFNFSIKENIRLARPKASNAEIEEVCRRAHIHEFIADLPDRYDTYLGEKGVRLSGGQKQRLLIARAFLKKPTILIFDEATSQMDPETERHIQNSLEQLSDIKTIIIVAHRLSSIKIADRILVMDQGRIVGSGTHDDLIRTNALYQALFSEKFA